MASPIRRIPHPAVEPGDLAPQKSDETRNPQCISRLLFNRLLIDLALTIMPTISMFYGIIIRMYYAPGEHPPLHFHVYYSEYKATVNIRTAEIIEGNLPEKQAKLVLAWTELHQDELMANWYLVMNGEVPFRVQQLQ